MVEATPSDSDNESQHSIVGDDNDEGISRGSVSPMNSPRRPALRDSSPVFGEDETKEPEEDLDCFDAPSTPAKGTGEGLTATDDAARNAKLQMTRKKHKKALKKP